MRWYDGVSSANQERAGLLDREIHTAAAQVHVAMARLAVAAADFDELGGWGDGGIRSFSHWLSLEAGVGSQTASELLRVGQALRTLPHLARAFGEGRLSFDKVRWASEVATADTDELMTEVACGATGAQVQRICRSVRRMTEPADAENQAQRGLWTRTEDSGMLRLVAVLPPEEGAIVLAAIESVAASLPSCETADEPAAARRADALVTIAEHLISGGASGLVAAGESRQLVVHVDVGVLTGEDPDGACQLENGVRLSAEAARRIGCDTEIVPVTSAMGSRSTSAGSTGPRRRGCVARLRYATASAVSPDAECPRVRRMPTTMSPGSWAARPTSPACCCCAAFTTAATTKARIGS